MRKLLLGVLLALSTFGIANAEPSGVRYVIRNDGGGSLNDYVQAFQVLKQNNVGVKLDGMCASACTLLTSTEIGLDYCVTNNAVLGIHHPFMMDSNKEIIYSIPAIAGAGEVWSEMFYKKYPQWLQKIIDANNGAPDVYKGAAPNDILEVKFDELKKHVTVCN